MELQNKFAVGDTVELTLAGEKLRAEVDGIWTSRGGPLKYNVEWLTAGKLQSQWVDESSLSAVST